jgi:hypothetical protein
MPHVRVLAAILRTVQLQAAAAASEAKHRWAALAAKFGTTVVVIVCARTGTVTQAAPVGSCPITQAVQAAVAVVTALNPKTAEAGTELAAVIIGKEAQEAPEVREFARTTQCLIAGKQQLDVAAMKVMVVIARSADLILDQKIETHARKIGGIFATYQEPELRAMLMRLHVNGAARQHKCPDFGADRVMQAKAPALAALLLIIAILTTWAMDLLYSRTVAQQT